MATQPTENKSTAPAATKPAATKEEKAVVSYEEQARKGGHGDLSGIGVSYRPDLDPGHGSKEKPTPAPEVTEMVGTGDSQQEFKVVGGTRTLEEK